MIKSLKASFYIVLLCLMVSASSGYAQVKPAPVKAKPTSAKHKPAISGPIGIFDGHRDIGAVKHKGGVIYDKVSQQYKIYGSGTNTWGAVDECHLAWKKIKGDFLLRASVKFLTKGGEPHRKLGWMIRSSLDSNAAHVSAVVHGDGLTTMQYRSVAGDSTQNVKSKLLNADVIQLERKGNIYTMSVAADGGLFVTEQVSSVTLGDEVYAGLYVCPHNADGQEKAMFSNVRIISPATSNPETSKKYIGSQIEVLNIETKNSTIIYQSPKSLQAPNWTKDSTALIYNSEGLLYKFDLKTKTPTVINSGTATDNNNDHVISFDGKSLLISDHSKSFHESLGYIMPIAGGEPRRVTAKGPSYMHGWSPDGKFVVYAGERNKDFDIYKIPSAGGVEVRLTTSPGLDDGPEYTPDGKQIWFNSVRSGSMQLWRMKPDGTKPVQMTTDSLVYNWFPHISPDGKWVVFLSFLKSEVKANEHSFYKHVYLWLMPVTGGPAKVIAYLYGGQGTINVPSWSPDSKSIAFISNNQLLYPVFPISK